MVMILESDTNCQISVNMTFTKWAIKEEQRCTHFINTGGRQRLDREKTADHNFSLKGQVKHVLETEVYPENCSAVH